jgi:hypothetical protein
MDVTELANYQKELAQKELNLKELAEQCTLFENFFETCPVNMGIVKVDTDNWKDLVVILGNPQTAKYYGIVNFQVYHNIQVSTHHQHYTT